MYSAIYKWCQASYATLVINLKMVQKWSETVMNFVRVCDEVHLCH